MSAVLRFTAPSDSSLSGPVHRHIRLLALAILTAASPFSASAQGFGILKKKVMMERKVPPMVYLGGETFSLQVDSTISVPANLLLRMRVGIENGLRDERRPFVPVIPPAGDPDIIISCTITRLDSSSRVETRTGTQYQKTGSHTVHNDQTNADETVDDYGWVSYTYDVTVVEGRLSLSYEARDAKTGMSLDAVNVTPYYKKEFQGGAGTYFPDPSVELVSNAAAEIVSRLVPSRASRVVLLPKGNLKAIGDLFLKGRWKEALARLQSMPAPRKAQDDAYRLYLIGVVYEWMGYASIDPAETRSYLALAVDSYRRASLAKPKESWFASSLSSASTALGQYEDLTSQIRAFELSRRGLAQQRNPAAVQAKPQAATPSRSGPAPLTNQTILDMVKSGTPQQEIVLAIKGSKTNYFDTTPTGLYSLNQAGVDSKIIETMRSHNRLPQSHETRDKYARFAASALITFAQLLPILIR